MKLVNPHLDHFPSLVAMFFDRAKMGGESPFLWRKADRTWQPLSWRQVAHQVSALAHHLRALGLKDGDRVITQGIGKLRPNQPVKAVPEASPQRTAPRSAAPSAASGSGAPAKAG